MADDAFIDSQVEALLESGVFERHWYMAQCGVYFHNSIAAAKHFIREGMPKEASPHPLIEPRVWPEHLRNAWKKMLFDKAMAWFRKPKLSQPAFGPLFEARYFEDIPDAAYAGHPGGLLGYILQEAEPGFELPTRYGKVPFAAVRRSWPESYSRLKSHLRLIGPRNTHGWDAARTAAWIADLPGVSEEHAQATISVIMPTWNRSEVVTSAIRSIQAQTHSNWELIVADDGSSDSTLDAVHAMAAADGRIRVLELDHGGVSAARNAGLDAATGEYLAFLDSDNQWPSTFLELMVRGLKKEGLRAAYAGLELHNEGKTTYRGYEGGHEHLLVVNHVDLNVFVVERSLATEVRFDESLRRWVDHDFVVRVAAQAELRYLPFIGCIYDDDRDMPDRITTSESEAWQWVVLGKNLVSWDQADGPGEIPGRVSVVIPIYQDWKMTLRAVQAVLENSDDADLEVILVDNGSAHYHGSTLSQFFAGEPRVRYERLPRNMNFAIGSNYGASIATGEFICFLNNDTEVRPGWLAPMLESIRDSAVRGVQPLLQYPDDSIQTAGTVFLAPRTPPTHFLTGLPPEDADAVSGMEFSAVTAACVLMRKSEVAQLKGFDPIYVNGMEDIDLCLRAIDSFGGHFVVNPAARVTHYESKTPGRGRKIPENRKALMDRWSDRMPPLDTDKFTTAGLVPAGIGGDKLWIVQPRPVVVRDRSKPWDRWGLRISSVGGVRGDRWGDTYYANSLAVALGRCGKKVLTYRHGANTETSQSFDDVNLVIRGLDKVTPIPDQLNVLWVISHPEDVTVEEVRAFDLVYASSASWAASMSARSGVEVRTLLQATDASIFYPIDEDAVELTRPLTFVGGHFPQRTRRAVADALTSGADLRIIGHGWRRLPETIHEAEGVPNAELGDVYRGATRVLADHWSDMAEMGFIQNRIFDAAACGTPVITDEVVGVSDVFGSLVQVYESVDHLRFLASSRADDLFGTYEARKEQAQDVLAQHSFDARAAQLIADVAARRAALFGA
ncbi:glycosyltransferase [Brachybacterium sp. DNPG3]